MNVLLVSPMDPEFPKDLKYLMGGENTYTKTLLKNPPMEVRYTHYIQALENGDIEYTLWQPVLTWLIKLRILPLDAGYHCIKLLKKFDLIHCHVYCLKLDGRIKPPVVLSDSSSNYIFLRDYVFWHPTKIALQYKFRKLLHKIISVYDKDLFLYKAKLVIVFSQFAKKIHNRLGIPNRNLVVVPPGLPNKTTQKKKISKKIKILFVGTWFERKGGKVLLEAYKILKIKYPKIHLIIVGPIPGDLDLAGLSIEQYDYVQNKFLLKKIYPSADIFVLIPPKAEGYGVVVLEALSFGLPVIVSNVCALPEIIENGKSGFVVKAGDLSDFINSLETLIKNDRLRKKMGIAALKLFKTRFEIAQTNKELVKTYRKAISYF